MRFARRLGFWPAFWGLDVYKRQMQRNMYYSSVLGVNLGMFYKRRDYSRVVNGRNPIVAHEYLGESVEGTDVFVADDIISSGESMLAIAFALKKQGARRIFANATYAIFTNGLAAFDEAVEQGCLLYTSAALCCQKQRWVWLCWLAAQAAVAAAYFAVYLRHGPVY